MRLPQCETSSNGLQRKLRQSFIATYRIDRREGGDLSLPLRLRADVEDNAPLSESAWEPLFGSSLIVLDDDPSRSLWFQARTELTLGEIGSWLDSYHVQHLHTVSGGPGSPGVTGVGEQVASVTGMFYETQTWSTSVLTSNRTGFRNLIAASTVTFDLQPRGWLDPFPSHTIVWSGVPAASYTWQKRLQQLREWRGDPRLGEVQRLSGRALTVAERVSLYAELLFRYKGVTITTVIVPLGNGGVQLEWTVRDGTVYHLEIELPPDFHGQVDVLRTRENTHGDILEARELSGVTLPAALTEVERLTSHALRARALRLSQASR
jgi:hypothetical protein